MPSLEAYFIRDSRDVVRRIAELESRRRSMERAHATGGPRPTRWNRVQFSVWDFTTLYPSLPHADILTAISSLLNRVFKDKIEQAGGDGNNGGDGAPYYLKVTQAGGRSSDGARWVRAEREGGAWVVPKDRGPHRHFSAEMIMRDLRFILSSTFMTVGDEVLQQVCGVPMGLSCSPMVSVMMLAWHEVRMLERMAEAVAQRSGSKIDTPQGQVRLTAASRAAHVDLAVRISRCCRAIDDVLLIDLKPSEQRWVLDRMYPRSLELKKVCASPERIQYLDLEVCFDRGGFHTMLYDKRDELRLQGKMDVVRRFPHAQSALSEECKYACLSSFLHRALRVDMRMAKFIRHASERLVEMYCDGYEMDKLLNVTRRFLQSYFKPHERWRAVMARIQEKSCYAAETATRVVADVPRRAGAPWAIRKLPRRGKKAGVSADAPRGGTSAGRTTRVTAPTAEGGIGRTISPEETWEGGGPSRSVTPEAVLTSVNVMAAARAVPAQPKALDDSSSESEAEAAARVVPARPKALDDPSSESEADDDGRTVARARAGTPVAVLEDAPYCDGCKRHPQACTCEGLPVVVLD